MKKNEDNELRPASNKHANSSVNEILATSIGATVVGVLTTLIILLSRSPSMLSIAGPPIASGVGGLVGFILEKKKEEKKKED